MIMRDMKPSELARKTGIGEGAISQYRKGAYKATQSNLEKISHALSVPIPWLIGVTDELSTENESGLPNFFIWFSVVLDGFREKLRTFSIELFVTTTQNLCGLLTNY